MKPMTSHDIEATITQAHADVLAHVYANTNGEIKDRGVARVLRAVFTAGQDNGQAIILERAELMFDEKIATEQVTQLGKSMDVIIKWVAAKAGEEGRLLGGLAQTVDGRWQASVMVARAEKGTGPWSHYQVGSTPAEALSKVATWCTEHTQRSEAATEPDHGLPEAAFEQANRALPPEEQRD